MKVFQLVKTLSKNKATVGDVFIIEGNERTVAKITTTDIHMTNGTQYNKKMFNHWMRVDKLVEQRDEQSKKYKEKIDQIYEEVTITRKEAKRIYDEKYRQPAINRVNSNECLKTYIVLTGTGATVKWYFSPTFKADAEDLELSYKSLHGTKYCAFAYGQYIQHGNNIAIVGINSYKDRNLSDKRKAFAFECLKQTEINGEKIHAIIYKSLDELFSGELLDIKSKLLSSPTIQPASTNRHWSGLNGEIAQDMFDQGISQMLGDDESPF